MFPAHVVHGSLPVHMWYSMMILCDFMSSTCTENNYVHDLYIVPVWM